MSNGIASRRSALFLSRAVAAAVVAIGCHAYAAPTEWKVGAGSWTTSGNWTAGVPEGAGAPDQYVYIGNGGTAQIPNSGVVYGENLYLGDRAAGTVSGGTINQAGGQINAGYVYVRTTSGNNAVYNLSGGLFQAWGLLASSTDGTTLSGNALFSQTGGTARIVGYNNPPFPSMALQAANTGTVRTLYQLSGGELVATRMGMTGKARFASTGGNATFGSLIISPDSTYSLAGGSLTTTRLLDVDGTIDFTSGTASIKTITASGLIDLTNAKTTSPSLGALVAGPKSLVILPVGKSGTDLFGGGYTNAGLEVTAGSPIAINAGQDIEAWGTLETLVTVAGSLKATPLDKTKFEGEAGTLSLRAGVFVTGNGAVDTGVVVDTFSPTLNGTVHVNNANSGMDGGSLKSWIEYIGSTSNGTFTHSGGVNNVEWLLLSSNYGLAGYPNSKPADGLYKLSGGTLNVTGTFSVGDGGKGTFEQTGGTANIQFLKAGSSNKLVSNALDPNGIVKIGGGVANISSLWLAAGDNVKASYEQTNGEVNVAGFMLVSDGTGTQSTLNVSGGNLNVGNSLSLGVNGSVVVTQSGGVITANGGVILGGSTGSSTQSYALSGDGKLITGAELVISGHSTPSFNQSGGEVIAKKMLVAGNYTGGDIGIIGTGSTKGSYTLSGGTLDADIQYIGRFGTGTFTHSGGTNTAATELHIATGTTGMKGTGTYALSGTGVLNVGNLVVGVTGQGTLSQTGNSSLTATSLAVGGQSGATGVMNYSGGSFAAPLVVVGDGGKGTFNQLAGNIATSSLTLGKQAGGDGTYNLAAGSLTTGVMHIGAVGNGKLIAAAGTSIEVSQKLILGPGASLDVAPGTTILMTGSTFENHSTSPTALADMADLTLWFQGGPNVVDTLEVAGRLGSNDFLLDGLTIGGPRGVGIVSLVDLIDNQPGSEPEVLYLNNLTVDCGSILVLNDIALFVDGVRVLEGDTRFGCGTIVNSLAVPEPGTAISLLAGAASLLLRRRRSLQA
jgi:hypothetical protein